MDLLHNIEWRAKYVPKPTLIQEKPHIDFRGLTKLQTDPFLDYLVKGEMTQYESFESTMSKIGLYHDLVLVTEAFTELVGSDYDKNSLATTTALSLLKPSHTFLDEFGAYTMSTPSSIALADPSHYMMRYEKQVTDLRKVKASYPRGKNTGLPLIISGMNRSVNNIVNVINLLVASKFQDWLYTTTDEMFSAHMKRTLDYLDSEFGYATSQVVFMRGQHTGKPTFVRFSDDMRSWYKSTNLFHRRRIVNSTIKYVAMALKAAVKSITEVDLVTPAFEQDHARIVQRIKTTIANGGVVLASDSGRFDLRHGLDKKDHLYEKVLGPRFDRMFGDAGKKLIQLSLIEADSTTLIPTLEGVYAGDGPSILKSGESLTSRKGSYMNLVDDMTLTRESLYMNDRQVNEYYLKHQPSVLLGDDLLKFFPSMDDAEKYNNALSVVSPQMGIAMELERPTKYLGKLVVNTTSAFDADVKLDTYFGRKVGVGEWIQPLSSIIQKTALPERYRSEKFPALAAMVKFFAMPYNAPSPDDFVKADIPDLYVRQVKKFYEDLARVRFKHGDSRHVYFSKVAQWLPDNTVALKALYVDVLKNPKQYGVDVVHDADDILNLLMKGLEHDANWAIVGLDESFEEAQFVGTLDEAIADVMGMPADQGVSSFVIDLIRQTNELKYDSPDYIQNLYSIVTRNHKSLGTRHSHGLPVW